jgi:23S rRNA (guanosine2251-2'-O)-methyltransferase
MKKQDVLYGIHPVREAIQAGRRHISNVIFASGKLPERLARIREVALKKRIPVKTASNSHLGDLAKSDRHQGVIAEAGGFETTPLEMLSEIINKGSSPPFILVADSITDPMNLGALIRTALAVGVMAVITPKDRCAPPTPTVSSASAGALEHIKLVQVTNLVRTLGMLQENGIWTFGLDHRAGQDCFHSDFTGPAALVIGGEGKGIRPLVKNSCDHLVSIPQNGPVTSLNASVAGAVVMYEAYRQRMNIEHRTSNIE